MAVAGAASAGTSAPGVTGDAGTTVRVHRANGIPTGVLSFGAGSGSVTTPSGGADYNAFVAIDPTSVTFESADAVSGTLVTGSSTSEINITFTNGSNKTVVPVFKSTIVPAGLGFYLADTSGGCGGDPYGGCPPIAGGASFSDLHLTGIASGGVANAGFDFTVLSDGSPIYDLAGSMRLDADGVLHQDLNQAASALDAFTLATPAGSTSNVGYLWGATPIALSTLTPLAPGASRTITYRVTVNSNTQARCINTVTCLVAYAGFGDPVGRGGGITSALTRALSGLPSASSPTGLTFNPATFNLPTFQNGQLVFQSAAIPEPGTWALMLLGVGAIGARLRMARRSPSMA